MPKLTTHQKLGKLSRIPFTKSGFSELQRKLENLKTDRPAAVKELARARELGDLSENGLYTAAKARLISIDNQIFRSEMTIKLADVVDDSINNSNTIQIGSKVIISDGEKEIEYKLVGDLEANPQENKISQHSPIGRTLLGKKVGENALLEIPSGTKSLKILKIS